MIDWLGVSHGVADALKQERKNWHFTVLVAALTHNSGMETCVCCRKKGQGTEGQGDFLPPRTVSGKKVYIHEFCALFSPQVYQNEAGRLVHVAAEIQRGNELVGGLARHYCQFYLCA